MDRHLRLACLKRLKRPRQFNPVRTRVSPSKQLCIKKSKFTEEQIVRILKEVAAGAKVDETGPSVSGRLTGPGASSEASVTRGLPRTKQAHFRATGNRAGLHRAQASAS